MYGKKEALKRENLWVYVMNAEFSLFQFYTTDRSWFGSECFSFDMDLGLEGSNIGLSL